MRRVPRERAPDRRPRTQARPPCEVHGAGYEHGCLACRLLKRDAIAVAIRIVSHLVGSAVSARSQRAWLRAIQIHPDFDLNRRDGRANLLAVADVVMWCAKRSPADPLVWTSIPTRARIMAATGLSETAVKKWLRWLRERGLLATVVEGSTPRWRPGTRCGQDDDGAGNLGAEYALTIPVATSSPQNDSQSLSGPPSPAPEVPQPNPSRDPGQDVQGAPAAFPVEEKRPPTVVLSEERTTNESSPIARAREAAPSARGDDSGTAWTWPLTATPETKIDMLKAAQALRTRSPILRRVTAKHLRSLLREHFRAGWTPSDVLDALDHTPDGTAWTLTSDPQWLPGWIRYRLTPWHTPDGAIAPSPSQRRAARRQAAAAARAAAAAEHERLLAHRADAGTHVAAARAALVAASPKAAAVIQQQDHRRDRLNFVKKPGSDSGTLNDASPSPAALKAAESVQASELSLPVVNRTVGRQRRAERHDEPLPPDWITMREPEEVFQHDVVDRHRLAGEKPRYESPAAAAIDRAWLARTVAVQRVTADRDSDDQ